MSENGLYEVKISHKNIRREINSYVNQAKSLGFKTEGFSELQAYVQLIGVVAQIEHNNQRKFRDYDINKD